MIYKKKSTPYSQNEIAIKMRLYRRTEKGRKQLKAQQERNKQIRLELIEYLGNKCTKCGYRRDPRALQVDHINGGGHQEQRTRGGSVAIYRYYHKHPFEAKQKLQVLCANCNAIKRHENQEFAKTRWSNPENLGVKCK